jgi:hypothetical protein
MSGVSRVGTMVRHPYFERVIDGLLLVNAIVIVVELSTTLENAADAHALEISQTWSIWELIETCFSCLYVLEMAAKVIVDGGRAYWRSIPNRFDAVITVTTFVIDIYSYLPNAYRNHALVKVLLTARCLRICRLILNVERSVAP